MHHIYHTHGIILGSKNIGESNRLLFVLTKDLGLVLAVAQGVRELKSKLRYSLQDFSVSAVSMVRGKDIWRVTSAEEISGYQYLFEDKKKAVLIARIFGLLRRLVHGEERNEQLFDILSSLLVLLKDSELSKEDLWRAELITNLQILSTLGYESDKPTLTSFVRSSISHELLDQMVGKEKPAVREINAILKDTQL